ncbi:MAG TPA: choice-of-anchor tandem repeat GloVer-containing protein, partial [Chitinophagaceae bacterium]
MKRYLLFICLFAHILSVQAQTLYGLTSNGGNDGVGTLIKFMAGTNNLTVEKSFENTAKLPGLTSFIQASDGKLYGVTATGGNNNVPSDDGGGVIFSFDPSTSTYTKLKNFDGTNGAFPSGSLVQASNGKLYGMAGAGGGNGNGIIYSFDPSNSTYTKLLDLNNTDARTPNGSLVQAFDGKLYGMTTQGGGPPDAGVIFSFDPLTSTYTKLKSLGGTNGIHPFGSLIQASNGKLYGMTLQGGAGYNGSPVSGYGVIFSFDPSTSSYTKVKDFDIADGINPYGSLVQGNNGKLYGMTRDGGSLSNGYGVIFSFDPSTSVYTKLKDFDGANGARPWGNLIQAGDGKLYGMTREGGNGNGGNAGDGGGVIFSFDPATSTYTKLKDFEATNGIHSLGSLVQANNGKLYGMTARGGSSDAGVIFSLDPSTSNYTKLKNFEAPDGIHPAGSLMQASDGKVYGMTSNYGLYNGGGVIFSFDPSSSTYTKLRVFSPDNNNAYAYTYSNGALPYGSLMQANNGKLYGMTLSGGGNDLLGDGAGVIFSFDPSNSTYTKLKDFDSYSNGVSPYGSLVQASDGKLYGMTNRGGSQAGGVIFSFNPSTNAYTKLKEFDYTNRIDGRSPYGSLVQASNGKLYGMTREGGSDDGGVIFSFDPSTSTYTKVKDLNYTDGRFPYGSLVQASNGKLYGMTVWGGSNDLGVIFSFDPSSFTYTKLKDFDGTNGANPYGNLMQASDGKLYGMTAWGGNNNGGVVFSFDFSNSLYTKLRDFNFINSPTGSWGSGLIELSNITSVSINITAGANPTCNGQSITFTATPVNGGGLPTYQWKVNGNNVGTNSPTYTTSTLTNGEVVSCVMTSSNPNATPPIVTSNAITITINSNVAPTASIAISAGTNPSCAGQSITFTASPANGGANPSYQWKIDGNNVGTNSATYTSNSLTNGQVVSCVMTSSLACASPATATSNPITVAINANAAPTASIAITSGTNPSCAGQPITFTASSTNGGANPNYQWRIDGNNVGANSTTYTSNSLTNGQVVSCVMASSLACANPATITSNPVTININASVAATASIAITSGSNPSCAGQPITFTASPTNGGANPTYQWKINGNNVGANSATYTSNSLTNGQVISCVMASSLACANPATVTSNPVIINISASVASTASIAISAGTNPSCAGQPITFTASPTNEGSNPSYQWKVNGNNVGTNSATYTSNSLTNGQVVSCVMTSSLACASPATASSNSVSMTISPVVVPSISISQTFCDGNTVGFTTSTANGGSNPSYLWSFTGAGTATNFTGTGFTLSNAANGAQVQCSITSNAACASPVTVTSAPLRVTCVAAGVVSPANLDFQVHPNPANQNATITFYL